MCKFGLNMIVMMIRMISGLVISLGLLKQSPPLKTKQCNGQQLCICGKSQTAGLDRLGWMEGKSKVSFKFFSIQDIFITIFIYPEYIFQSYPHKFLEGFKFWSSWGTGCKKSKSTSRVDFFPHIKSRSSNFTKL